MTPRDALGLRLEAVDFIRIDDEVFITLLPPREKAWNIEICGYDIINVKSAERHFNNIVQKVLNKQTQTETAKFIVLDQAEGIEVELQAPGYWWPVKGKSLQPRLLPCPMNNDPGNFRSEPMHPIQLSVIQSEIKRSLETIRFERGSYDLSISLGCLAVDGFEDPKMEIGKKFFLPNFIDSIFKGAKTCTVRKWFVPFLCPGRIVASNFLQAL